MNKPKKEKTVPGPTIRGTYNTYENRRRRSLVADLGHVVDLELEQMLSIEVASWGTSLVLRLQKGVTFSIRTLPDGTTKIYFTRRA
jgi:hypothetical protein